MLSSFRVDDTGRFRWTSAPAFRSDDDLMVGCGWVVELAEGDLASPRRVRGHLGARDLGR
jgi:hypothetical protein